MTGDVDALDLYRVIAELERLRTSSSAISLDLRDTAFARAKAVEAYEKQRARVRLRTSGSVQTKDDTAVLDDTCARLRAEMETAKTVERYAKARADDRQADQSNLQTQANVIETVLRLSGTGR